MDAVPLLMASAQAASAGAEAAAHGSSHGHGAIPFPILITLAAVAFLGTLASSRLAIQLRLPAVLGVLLLGLLLHPSQRILSLEEVENLHVVSLSMLLFCAGLNAELHQIRGVLRYGALLAAGGVLISCLVLGGVVWAIHAALAGSWPGLGIAPLPLPLALMAGACLSCTDGNASLEVLRRAGLRLPERLHSLVNLESSLNDPLAILLLLLLTGFGSAGVFQGLDAGHLSGIAHALQAFLKSIGSGVMVGLILTYVAQFILRRLVSSSNQILLVGIAVAVCSYGLANLLHGSGFISAYVTGLFLANDIYANEWVTPELLENSLEPFNTMMEFTVFLLFGTLIDPASISQALLPGLLACLALILVARPLSVFALQPLSPLTGREGWLLSWCGLRGAVSLALGYTAIHAIPHLPGVQASQLDQLQNQMEGLIFVVVVGTLCLQGLSLPLLYRRLTAGAEPS